ncbi:MAG TPA: hypothetical protein VHN74_16955 [Candidatus Angelobacter sp.]|jgi:opacity protein-like surface antigen|nr:hypothetical protein [Candidatus Angelobacter sp.]
MRRHLLVLGILTLVCLNAHAQKNELALVAGGKITPTVGSTATGNQTDFSTSFAFEANYAAQLVHVPFVALHLEFPFVASPSTDITSSNAVAVKSYNSIFFTPSLRLKFVPGSPISPWISAGGGISHFNPGSTTQAGTSVNTASTTKSAVQGGAGLDFHIPMVPIALRFEARDFYTGIPNLNTLDIKVRHNILVGGGVVLRF